MPHFEDAFPVNTWGEKPRAPLSPAELAEQAAEEARLAETARQLREEIPERIRESLLRAARGYGQQALWDLETVVSTHGLRLQGETLHAAVRRVVSDAADGSEDPRLLAGAQAVLALLH